MDDDLTVTIDFSEEVLNSDISFSTESLDIEITF